MRLINWFLGLFSRNVKYFPKPEVFNTLPKAYKGALKDLGIREILGSRMNAPRILEYHTYTNLDAKTDEIAWCSSAMCCWQEESGIKGTRSAAARSWLKWGEKEENPTEGCVVVFSRGKSWQGHVGFYVKSDKKYVWCLGGNQGDSVSVRKYKKSKVLDYRKAKL